MGVSLTLTRQTCPGLTSIGKGAFAAAHFRQSIMHVPGTLRVIPDYAFWGANIGYISEGIEEIGDYAFAAILPEDAPFQAELYRVKPGKKANSVFAPEYCGSDVKLPLSLKSIGEYAFAGVRYYLSKDSEMENFNSIRINAEKIGGHAFCQVDCRRHKNASQKEWAIILTDNVREVGEYAFSGMTGGGFHVILGSQITALPDGMFMNTSIVSLTLPENLQSISDNAFNGTRHLGKIVLPPSVVEIGENAFRSSGLTSVAIPENANIIRIGSNAFSDNNSLSEIYLPSTVEFIGENAFDKKKITLVAEENSYAARWAQENGYSCRFNGVDSTPDWLTQ